jgi:branched-chain amino acid transport system permease protein
MALPVRLVERTPAKRIYAFLGWGLFAFFLLYVPWFAHKPARIDQFSQVLAFAVAILGLNLVLGFSGQISLGHSVFVGLGAYTTVILVADHHWGYLTTFPVSFALCFVAGVVVGLPALRIRGLYLAVVTLSFAVVFPTLVLHYDTLTNGANGKQASTKMTPPSWISGIFDPKTRFGPVAYRYMVLLVIAAIMFLLVRNLMASRVGRSMIATRDNQTSAAVSGVNLPLVRVLSFGMSGAVAGVAGSMLMIQNPQAVDTRFDVTLAIFLVVALVIGGVATLWGAVPGALAFIFVPYYTTQWTEKLNWLKGRPGAGSIAGVIYGIVLLLFVFVLPGGVMDGIHRLRRRLVRVIPNPSWLPAAARHSAVEAAPTPVAAPADTEPLASADAEAPPPMPDLTSTTNRGSNA